MKPHHFFGVYTDGKSIFTKNLVPGVSVYGEILKKTRDGEFRFWDPKRSKLAAFIFKKAQQTGLKPGIACLYLGASTGTTVSHVSDIVGADGIVFAIDSAPTVMKELVLLAEQRPNIAPILADAGQPELYKGRLIKVDWLYQDVAQPHQLGIFVKAVKEFLKPGCFAMLAVKARSIDIAKKPKIIFKETQMELEKHFTIIDIRNLEPFQKDHCLFVVKN